VRQDFRFTVSGGGPGTPNVGRCIHCQKRMPAVRSNSWVSFPRKGLAWTGDSGEPTWFSTRSGPHDNARILCHVREHVAAFDYGDTLVRHQSQTALDETDEPRSYSQPVFRGDAVSWAASGPRHPVHSKGLLAERPGWWASATRCPCRPTQTRLRRTERSQQAANLGSA